MSEQENKWLDVEKLIKDNDIERIKEYLAEGMDPDLVYFSNDFKNINRGNMNHDTILMKSLIEEHAEIVEMVINAGADVNKSNFNGITPMNLVAANNDVKMAKLLMKRGACFAADEKKKIEPSIVYAAKYNNLDVLKLLIEAGANPYERTSRDWTTLELSLVHDANDVFEFLIQYAPIEKVELNKCLMRAADNNNLYGVKKMIQLGADINSQDDEGNSVLAHAILAFNGLDVAEFLIDNGADVNQMILLDPLKETLLTQLIKLEQNGSIDFLLNKGVDVNKPNHTGDTPLIIASVIGNLQIVQSLLQKGAEIDKQGKNKSTALIEAVKNKQINVATALVNANADINAKDNIGKDVLSYFIEYNSNPYFILTLVKAGLDINRRNSNNLTPLMEASGLGFKDKIVKVLIDAGAYINALNGRETAIDYARKNRRPAIKEILEENNTAERMLSEYILMNPELDNGEPVASFEKMHTLKPYYIIYDPQTSQAIGTFEPTKGINGLKLYDGATTISEAYKINREDKSSFPCTSIEK